jgi:hypothetical protein
MIQLPNPPWLQTQLPSFINTFTKKSPRSPCRCPVDPLSPPEPQVNLPVFLIINIQFARGIGTIDYDVDELMSCSGHRYKSKVGSSR